MSRVKRSDAKTEESKMKATMLRAVLLCAFLAIAAVTSSQAINAKDDTINNPAKETADAIHPKMDITSPATRFQLITTANKNIGALGLEMNTILLPAASCDRSSQIAGHANSPNCAVCHTVASSPAGFRFNIGRDEDPVLADLTAVAPEAGC